MLRIAGGSTIIVPLDGSASPAEGQHPVDVVVAKNDAGHTAGIALPLEIKGFWPSLAASWTGAQGILAPGIAPALTAEVAAADSPGVISGNALQIPIHVPINLCGNSIDLIALLNPTFGNTCVADAPTPVAAGSTLSVPLDGPASPAAGQHLVNVIAAKNDVGQLIGIALPVNIADFDANAVAGWEGARGVIVPPQDS